MRASKRYQIEGRWHVVGFIVARPFFLDEEDRREVRIIREVANIRDTKGGYFYENGAYRVKSVYVDTGKSHSRSKTFYGEFAWSNSRRMYADIITTVERAREAS